MARIPRGIQVVRWNNEHGPRSVRYRVRIQRKNFKADGLFDTLEEAENFLHDSRSEVGRKEIVEQTARQKALEELMRAPPLSYYLDEYERKKLPTKAAEKALPEKERKRVSVARSRLSVIKEQMVEDATGPFSQMGGMLATVVSHPKKRFGDIKLADLTPKIAASYVEARIAGASESTAKRDVSFLSSFFNTFIPEVDQALAAKVGNPFANQIVKKQIRGADKRRDVRLADFGEDAETRLMDALRACRNQEMVQIVGLALTTGQRRGEILGLTWDRVFPTYIQLEEIDTKNGKPRRVPLSQEARQIIEGIKCKKGRDRVFSYTTDGFKSVWDRVRKRAGMPTLRIHDLRHEFISRLLEHVASPIVVAATVGASSVKNFEAQHVEPAKKRKELENGVQSEYGLMLAVGHSDTRMTAHYASVDTEKVMASVDAAKQTAAMQSPVKYPVVVDDSDGYCVFMPDFEITVACETLDEAIKRVIEQAGKAPGEKPKPSSQFAIAKAYPGAHVRLVEV